MGTRLERDHKASLVDRLAGMGILVDARMQGPGALGRPDIIATVKPTGRTLVVEMKRSTKEAPTDLQWHYLRRYAEAGALAFVVYGDDFEEVINAVKHEMNKPDRKDCQQ